MSTARLWRLQLDELIDLACRTTGRNLSYTEWDQYFRGEQYRATCPDIPIHHSVITNLIGQGKELAQQGKIEEAIAAYEKARTFDPTLNISAQPWNTLCWNGSLLGYAAEVMNICEQAVELAPEHGGIRDSRGLARALMGDIEGAIEDFRAFVDWMEEEGYREMYKEEISQRQRWIDALRAGENPFTPEVLEKLRRY